MWRRTSEKKSVTLHVYESILDEFNQIVSDEFNNNKGLVQSAAMLMFAGALAEDRQKWVDAILLAEHRGGGEDLAGAARDIMHEWLGRRQVVSCRKLPDGKIIDVSDSLERLFSTPRHDIIGCNMTQFVPEEDREAVFQAMQSATVDVPTVNYTHRFCHPVTGQVGWVRCNEHAVFNSQGVLTEYQCICTILDGPPAANDATVIRPQPQIKLAPNAATR